MAKIPFSKLEAKPCNTIHDVCYLNSKGEEVYFEVKCYLPIEEKMDMISKIINQSTDDNGFYNPMRVKIFTTLEIVYAYTNLTFTSKQKENFLKLYDSLISTGIFQSVIDNIFEEDCKEIQDAITTTIDNIYKYRNSAMGILENVVADYGDLSLDASNISSALADPNNMAFLKSVLSKLG